MAIVYYWGGGDDKSDEIVLKDVTRRDAKNTSIRAGPHWIEESKKRGEDVK